MKNSQNNDNSVFGMVKLGCILALYAAVSCTVLAVVNNFTTKKIQENQLQQAKNTLSVILPDADEYKVVAESEQAQNQAIKLGPVYLGYKDGKVTGAAIQVQGPTYDKAKIMVAVNPQGIITGMRFLELSDSPGFGLKANDPTYKVQSGKTFYEQFTGKDVKKGFVPRATFDAITGATITSNGTAALMTEGCTVLMNYLGEHK